ncbi:MAG: twin-arginine translocase TatA/TatE family subunit [Acidobacteriota bacterium]
MGSLGWPEILMILVVALIIFGPRKLPELGKTLGNALAQFRRASEDFKRTWEEEVETEKRKLEASVRSLDEPVKSSYDDSTAGSSYYDSIADSTTASEPASSATETNESAETTTSNTDSPYWSQENPSELSQTAASVEENLENATQTVPTITPETQAVPRQTKRDWM